MLQIGYAEGPEQNDLAVPYHRDLQARNSTLQHLTLQQRLNVLCCGLSKANGVQADDERQKHE